MAYIPSRQLDEDIKKANEKIGLILSELKEKYPLKGIRFSLINKPETYITMDIDVNADAIKSYFNKE